MLSLSGVGSRRVVCLDWDARMVRAVHAAVARGGARVLGVAEEAIPADVDVAQAGSFGTFLRSFLRNTGFRADRLVVDIPRQDAVLNPLTLPPTADHELASMVRFQISKELPFAMDQAVVDFAVQRRDVDAKGSIELLVAAIRNHVVDYYKAVAESAGVQIDRIGLRPYANVMAITRDRQAPSGRVVFVDVGPSMTEIDVLRDGKLAFSRAAGVNVRIAGEGSAKLPPAVVPSADADVIPFAEAGERSASAVDELLVEVTRTVEAYRATDAGAAIDRIIVAGATGIEKALADALAQRFRAPANLYRPSESITRQMERRSQVEWAAFSAVLGLAWGQGQAGFEHFDFLHPKQPIDIRKEKLRKVPVVLGGVAVIVLATTAAAAYKIHEKSNRVAELDTQLAAAKKERQEIERFNALVNEAVRWRDESVIWLDELRALAETLDNKETYLRELTTTEKGEIKLTLVAADARVFAKLRLKLGELRDKHDKPLYVVTAGQETPFKDDKYKVQTEIRLQIKRMAPPSATQRAKR